VCLLTGKKFAQLVGIRVSYGTAVVCGNQLFQAPIIYHLPLLICS
jgi:hypothetical protein